MSDQHQPAQLTIAIEQKSIGITYVLWAFFGLVGVHQFYLGKPGRAVSMLLTLGWLTVGVFVDLFTIPGQVRKVNAQLAADARARQQQEG